MLLISENKRESITEKWDAMSRNLQGGKPNACLGTGRKTIWLKQSSSTRI